MRPVARPGLPAQSGKYLVRKQQQVLNELQAGSLNIQALWKSARQTKSMGDVLKTLQRMMGKRERCMYCLDSHGCDIEHFRPKASFPSYVFVWENLLLCCTECGRLKGDRFPLDSNAQPLIIDPSQQDPWLYLDFDPDTGNLSARYDPESNDWSELGKATVEHLHLDRREALSTGYFKTFRRLQTILRKHLQATAPIDSEKLIQQLIDEDDHGLLGWSFREPSAYIEPPFDTLRKDHPAVWSACRQELQQQRLI